MHADLFRDMAGHIDGTYTNNPSRTLIGRGSEAGIVLLELFGEGPEEAKFDNYVATDAANQSAKAALNTLEGQDFSEAATSKKLHLCFSTTGRTQLHLIRLNDLLDQAEYPWLQYQSVSYPDTDYENTYPQAFADGLAFVLGD